MIHFNQVDDFSLFNLIVICRSLTVEIFLNRTSVQGNAKVVDLNSNAQQKLNVKDVGKEQDFVATGNKHTWEADPGDSDYKQGQLKNDGKPYDYTISKTADGKSQATLADQSQKSIFVGTKKYTCVGQKDGISNCQDEWGRKVGEVRGNKAGDVTVVNNLGIPIASAKAVKDSSGKPTVSVNNGIFNADSGQQVDKNCPGCFSNLSNENVLRANNLYLCMKSKTVVNAGITNDKVKPGKGITFKYANSRTVDGGQRWDWPACFDASIPVTLGAGILGKNLAFKFTPLVLPAGRLNCQDPATIACGSPAGQW
uniref:Uncharacterized protein n=1 Tax=Romanomermis culicivorax TaxID=13658 RepID=A0A915J5S3_ROMCU